MDQHINNNTKHQMIYKRVSTESKNISTEKMTTGPLLIGALELITTLIYLNWNPLLYGIHMQFYEAGMISLR